LLWVMHMETNVVILGDCLDVLRELPDNSIDSVVTDPPYGLSKEPDIEEVLTKWMAGEDYEHRGGGFMGKTWDSFVPGPAIWREVYRVLKPGGHALVFAGTRTQDLMTISLRLAGFEIRDVIEWLYFCLSEDTEILTCHGWVTYDKIEPYYKIACFNMETGKIEAHTPDAINIAPYSGDMVHLVSGETDQLVTPNHRLVIYEDGKFQFKPAEEADSREYTVYFADEEELCRVWRGILGTHEVSGGEEQVLFKRMQEEGESLLQQGKKTAGRTSRIGQDQLQCMRERGLEAKSLGEKGTKSGLLKGMQWETSDSSNFWGRSFKSMDGREEATITGEDEGGEQSILEGRGDASPFKRKLQGRDLCSVPGRVQGDGPERWVCDGASSNYGDGDWEATETNRGCSSHQPRSVRQPSGESGVVGEQCRPQITRSRKDGFIQTHISAASKRIVHYDGVVWCVTVPTGAFIARRNGRIFVTGNSGFPKSLDVSKAFDRRAGAEREVVGVSVHSSNRTKGSNTFGQIPANEGERLITAPATDLAKKWNGWGTALKPSHEPIIYARKPFNSVPFSGIMEETTSLLEVVLCLLLSSVNGAERIFRLSPSELNGESDFAVMSAALLHGERSGELKELMVTFNSPETVLTCLNIATLWNNILEESLKNGSMFTTKTETSLTTALKTLKSLLFPITQEPTIQAVMTAHGFGLNVSSAEKNLNDEGRNTSDILKRFVAVSATLRTGENGTPANIAVNALRLITPSVVSVLKHVLTEIQTNNAEKSPLEPAHEPIIMARKPLDGTVADNVERWGTGALNIDGCRIPATPEDIAIQRKRTGGKFGERLDGDVFNAKTSGFKRQPAGNEKGRFPANCVTTEPGAFFSKYFNITPPELSKKASKRDRNSDWLGREIDGGLVKIRSDLTESELEYVMSELERLSIQPVRIRG